MGPFLSLSFRLLRASVSVVQTVGNNYRPNPFPLFRLRQVEDESVPFALGHIHQERLDFDANRPDLDGLYAVFGRVTAGGDVPGRIQRGDLITRMYVKE